MPEYIWIQDEEGRALQANICASRILEFNQIATNIVIGAQVEDGAYELCTRIYTGSC